MEDAGQFNQQVNRAAAFTVLHAADMLLACQAQANRQFLLRNATGSANIVIRLQGVRKTWKQVASSRLGSDIWLLYADDVLHDSFRVDDNLFL